MEYCPEIALQEDFDLPRFAEKAWYPLLRIDDLPYGGVDCAQHNIDSSTSPMRIVYDWYYPSYDYFDEMDILLICDEEEPASCSMNRSGSGTTSFVATDYETYYMFRSCYDGGNRMKAFYVGAS